MSGRWIKVEQNGKKQAVQVKRRKPYGIERPLALEEVQELRKKGDKARLIETNRKRKLYAPYLGILQKDINSPKSLENAINQGGNNFVEVTEQPRKKLTYLDAVNNMKEVPVDLRLSGDRRKGSIYAAVITGTDPKYGLKREFLQGDRTYTGKNNITVDYQAKLKPGTIIETSEAGSWKNKYGDYYVVTDKGLRHLTTNYNNEGKLKVKDLMKAREKAINRTR